MSASPGRFFAMAVKAICLQRGWLSSAGRVKLSQAIPCLPQGETAHVLGRQAWADGLPLQ